MQSSVSDGIRPESKDVFLGLEFRIVDPHR